DDRIVSAAARQSGMIRARNFRTMVNYAKGLSLPPVKSNTLIVIARSGGRAVVAADMAAAFGFDLYPLPPAFREKVKGFFRAKVIEPTNPLDLGDLFDFKIYVNILEECLKIEDVDAVLIAHEYSSLLERKGTHHLAHAVQELSAKYNKPVALCPFSEGQEVLSLKKDLEYPTFSEIDEAMEALAVSRDRYRRSRKRAGAEGVDEPLSISPLRPKDELQQILASPQKDGVLMIQALEICQGYGIPVAEWATASNPEEAVETAKRLGYPLALKVLSPHISHKSDVGGIALDIRDEESLKRAWEEMLSRMQAEASDAPLEGFLLQRMVSGGQEVILGGKRDHSFGPVVMFGLGGIYVEVFDDVAFRVAPLTREDAEEMIAEVKGSRLLRGIRGEKPSDVEAVVDCLLRLSQLLQDFPSIAEVDINPLIVLKEGALAVDARVVSRR
ncbi:MAG: acetate--CoA ligase family protein, partial [Anaerolineae bacterium]|nr:acetate--CoA ligase family protein [Anaerolineae bacterium]